MRKLANKKGSAAPMKRPIVTLGSRMLTTCVARSTALSWTKATKSARAPSAAPAIAKPFVVAFVVLPTESSSSVTLRTFSGAPLISAIPPALSVIGP